jgi:outer membrane receptor protein involved in Fe transport
MQAGFTYYQAGPVRPGGDVASPDPTTYVGLERAPSEVYRPVPTRAQLGTEFEAYAADVALRTRLGAGTDLVLRGQSFVRPELVRYDQITPRFKRELPQRGEAGLRPLSRAMLSAELSHRQLTGWYDTASVLVAWQRIFERRFQRNLEESCSIPGAGDGECEGTLRLEAAGGRASEDNASNAFSLRAEARKANPTKSWSLIWGVDARHDIVQSSAESLDLATLVRAAESPRYPESSLSEAGLFAHSRLRAAPRFHLFSGVRAAAFHVDVRERNGEAPSPAVRDTLIDFAGSIGTHWEFADGVAWAANAARGVRSPNVEDFAGLGQRAGGRFQVPNPDLSAEHSYTLDTGLKLWRARDLLQSFIFYSRYEDAITLAPTLVDGQEQTEEGDRFYQSANAASVELYGFEGVLDLGLTPELRVRMRTLVMQGIQRNGPETDLPSVTPADRVPPAQAEVSLTYSPIPTLELEALAAGRAPQRRLNDPVNLDDNRIPEGGTPGYVTYHARAKVTAGALTLRLALDNITDERVLEHGSGFYRAGLAATASVSVNLSNPSISE